MRSKVFYKSKVRKVDLMFICCDDHGAVDEQLQSNLKSFMRFGGAFFRKPLQEIQ